MILSEMQTDPPPPTKEEAAALIRAAASKGLQRSRQGGDDLMLMQWDLQDVNELLTGCTHEHVRKIALDDRYEDRYTNPARNCYMVVTKWETNEEPRPLYVKVAFPLPNMLIGRLISFHYWGQR